MKLTAEQALVPEHRVRRWQFLAAEKMLHQHSKARSINSTQAYTGNCAIVAEEMQKENRQHKQRCGDLATVSVAWCANAAQNTHRCVL